MHIIGPERFLAHSELPQTESNAALINTDVLDVTSSLAFPLSVVVKKQTGQIAARRSTRVFVRTPD